jgi:16S rRNA (guanine527-N7)-methyltransferase
MIDTGPSLIYRYFNQLSDQQKSQIADLKPLYEEWNQKVNVISRKDMDAFYLHHVLHSLSIAKLFEFETSDQVLDLGTGGGFPGVPLAILFPETPFVLVDSIGKKIKVVQDVAAQLGLSNITAIHGRAEQVKGKFDFVVTRGVAPMVEIKHWVGNKIRKTTNWKSPHGIIFLKGGDLNDEISKTGQSCLEKNVSNWFEEDYFQTKKVVFLEI